MNNIAAHSGVRKVLISPKLEGKAGREHLSGILGFLPTLPLGRQVLGVTE